MGINHPTNDSKGEVVLQVPVQLVTIFLLILNNRYAN